MSTEPITQQELEELKDLDAAVTQGKWLGPDGYWGDEDGIRNQHGDTVIAARMHWPHGDDCYLHAEKNALSLAVAARNALPRLIAEVERLREELDTERTDNKLLRKFMRQIVRTAEVAVADDKRRSS